MLAWHGMALPRRQLGGPCCQLRPQHAALPPLPRHQPTAPPAAFVLGIALLAALRAYQSLPQALGAAVGVAGIVAIIAGESKRWQVPAWRPGFACPDPPACQGCH